MSRTPKADISKLPIWCQKLIAAQVTRIDVLEVELEEALEWVNNLESVTETLAKQLEEAHTPKHEDVPNTICSNRDCCPLPCGPVRV